MAKKLINSTSAPEVDCPQINNKNDVQTFGSEFLIIH